AEPVTLALQRPAVAHRGVARAGSGRGCDRGPAPDRSVVGANARLPRAVRAVPLDRQHRAGLLRVRLGVAAVGGSAPRRVLRYAADRGAARDAVRLPVVAVPGRLRGGAYQAALGSGVARPHRAGLPPPGPADARPLELVLPPPAPP